MSALKRTLAIPLALFLLAASAAAGPLPTSIATLKTAAAPSDVVAARWGGWDYRGGWGYRRWGWGIGGFAAAAALSTYAYSGYPYGYASYPYASYSSYPSGYYYPYGYSSGSY